METKLISICNGHYVYIQERFNIIIHIVLISLLTLFLITHPAHDNQYPVRPSRYNVVFIYI